MAPDEEGTASESAPTLPPPEAFDTIDLPHDEVAHDPAQEVADDIDKLVHEAAQEEAAHSPKSASRKKRVPRGPGCASCGPVNRNVDPEVMRRSKVLAKRRTRSLGFLGSDERRR